jgi:RNA polymerase sigma-70 factor (ECF subfamily)
MSGPSHPDPEKLLRSARAGDASALGAILERYRNYLSLLAKLQIGRRLQGKIDASDMVQDTFLKAQRDFAKFRGTTEREWVCWLRRILTLHFAQLIRRYYGSQRRDVRLERQILQQFDRSSGAMELGLQDSQSSPSQKAAREEQAVRLADALQQLPPHYQEVIILSHIEGLKFPEVAQRMGRGVESVKHLWARALDRLRQSLKDLR